MNKFWHAIDALALQDIMDMPLQGWRFTWSNEQEELIMATIFS
jgi:hypothetical protein